ncbi:MAG: hypothetical protein ABIH72_05250 [archaeon]
MIIGVDTDDVTADFTPAVLDFYNKRNGTSWKVEDMFSYSFWEVWGCAQQEAIDECRDFFLSREFDSVMPVEGSVEAVTILGQGNRLPVITSRPVYIRERTEHFYYKKFPPVFNGIYFSDNSYTGAKANGSKAELCRELKVDKMIEDSAEYALELANNGIEVLLLDTPWNQGASGERIHRFSSWEEITKYLT